MVFQKPNPFPAMTIRENVLAGLEARPASSCDEQGRAGRAVPRAGRDSGTRCSDRLDKPGGALSGGQQQRLCIARVARRAARRAADGRALLGARPDLDPPHRGDDRRAARRGHVVIVTHNMQQAQRVSDQLRLLPGRGERARPHRRARPDHGRSSAARRDQRTLDYVQGRSDDRSGDDAHTPRPGPGGRPRVALGRDAVAGRAPTRRRINGSGSTYVGIAMKQWTRRGQDERPERRTTPGSGRRPAARPSAPTRPTSPAPRPSSRPCQSSDPNRALPVHARRRRRTAIMYKVKDTAGRQVDDAAPLGRDHHQDLHSGKITALERSRLSPRGQPRG